MPERLRIECACGYENLVSPEKRGQTVECAVCGADLEVDETAVGVQTTAPDAPDRRGEAESDAADSSDRPYTSPFEDGTDDAEEDTPRAGGPFTLQAAEPSSNGESSFSSLMESARPHDFKSGHVVVRTESPSDRATGELCMECGRAIRGEWDRFQRPEGVLCYICSNQGIEGVPLRMQMESEREPRDLSERDMLIDPDEPGRDAPETPWYFDPESETFKRVVAGLAFATIFLAVFVSLFDWGAPDPEVVEQARSETAEALEGRTYPFIVTLLLRAWQVVGGALGLAVAFYLTRWRNGTLPYDDVVRNALYMGVVSVLLTCVNVVGVALGIGLTSAFGAAFAGAIVVPLIVGASLYLLVRMLDFGFVDFLWFLFLFLPISQAFVNGIGYAVAGGLAAMLT